MNEVAKDPIGELIGKRVRKLREAHGWSQNRMALECGLSRPNYARLERGIHCPSLSRLVDVARVLGVSLWDIVGVLEDVPEKEARDAITVSVPEFRKDIPRFLQAALDGPVIVKGFGGRTEFILSSPILDERERVHIRSCNRESQG